MKHLWTFLLLALVGPTIQSSREKRLFFGSLEDTVKDTYDGYVKDFLKALRKVSGLNENQVQQLETKFREDLNAIARPPSPGEPDFSYFAWMQYAAQMTTQAMYSTQRLLKEALEMVANNSPNKRQLFGSVAANLEKRIKNLYDDLTISFLRSLRRIRGLSEEQMSKLEDDFRNGMNSMPTPPLSGGNFLNPLAWLKFSADASKHALHLTGVLLQEARDMVANLIGQGKDELGNIADQIGDAVGDIEKEIGNILDEAEKNIEKGVNKNRF